jgi:hypothetical protein
LITICIGGGAIGASTVTYGLPGLAEARQVVAALIVIALYALGIIAGLALAEGKRNAIGLMIWFFAFQVPVVNSDIVSFGLSAPLGASIIFRGLFTFDVAWFFGSQWTLALFTPAATKGIGFNAVAVAFIIFLMTQGGTSDTPART